MTSRSPSFTSYIEMCIRDSVACGEAAGEHDDLSLADLFCKRIDGRTDVLCTQVSEYMGYNPVSYTHLSISDPFASSFSVLTRRFNSSTRCRYSSKKLMFGL